MGWLNLYLWKHFGKGIKLLNNHTVKYIKPQTNFLPIVWNLGKCGLILVLFPLVFISYHWKDKIISIRIWPKSWLKSKSSRYIICMVTIVPICSRDMWLRKSWQTPATSKYGGLRPRIWVYVTSNMLLPSATTNCGGLRPPKA